MEIQELSSLERAIASESEYFAQMQALEEAEGYPYFPVVDALGTNAVRIRNGPPLLQFGSCDYLGLARDPRVKAAAKDAIDAFGTTSGAPMFFGYTTAHERCDARLRAMYERPVVTFPSALVANCGVISALMKPHDTIVADRLAHVSIFLGAKLSGAQLRTFAHNDAEALDEVLSRSAGSGKLLVVVEGLYSVDGDLGKLAEICAVARRHGAILLVDEAHAVGTFGPSGGGAADHFGVLDRVDIVVGTMSKAVGSAGGFVAARQEIVEILRMRTPFYVNTTNLTPSAAGATAAALEIIAAEGLALRERLAQRARRVREGLQAAGISTLASESAIIPVVIGDPIKAGQIACRLQERGLMVGVITAPLVRKKSDRLRICVNATHTEEECDRAVALIAASLA